MGEENKKWFDERWLVFLARRIAKAIPTKNVVAVAFSDYYDCGNPTDRVLLNVPDIVAVSSDGDAIGEEGFLLLEEVITDAAVEIVAGHMPKYSTEEYPVLSIGIESKSEALGVLFVSVLASDCKLSAVEQSKLIEKIRDDACDDFGELGKDGKPMGDLSASWCYGTLFGDVVFKCTQ